MIAHPSPHRPEVGPRLLFFTGGSALRDTSRALVSRTHRSVHLVTTFDSGGSSAALRDALDMPAVGDLRNRLLALAAPGTAAESSLVELLGDRLPREAPSGELRAALERRLRQAPRSVADPVQSCLAAARGLDLRNASVGNLLLAGAWLEEGRSLERAVARFAGLVPVHGVVRPVTEENRHLAARLDDGSVVPGQHRITQGAWAAAGRRVERLYLVRSLSDTTPAPAATAPGVAESIHGADLICYPVGSLFTSVLAALLPAGLAETLARARVPKLWIPNPGPDPEERGLTPAERLAWLARFPLDGVLVDAADPRAELRRAAADAGVPVAAAPLGLGGDPPRYDATALASALLARVPATSP